MFWHGYYYKWLLRCGLYGSATTAWWLMYQNKASSTKVQILPPNRSCTDFKSAWFPVPAPSWTCFRNSPLLLMGCSTGCIRAGWLKSPVVGEGGLLPGLKGVRPCSAHPKQQEHKPEPSAVHFAYILTWCSASSLLFFFLTPETKSVLSSQGPPELQLLLVPVVNIARENEALYIWKHTSFSKQDHLS